MRYTSPSVKISLLATAVLVGSTCVLADPQLDSLMNGGKFKEAIAYSDKSLPEANRTVDEWLNIASALDKTSAPAEKVTAALKSAQKVSPSEPRVYLAFGYYAYKGQKYQEALDHFKKSYILDRSARAAEGIALSAAKLSKWDVARDAAESAVSLDPNVFESRLILADLYLKDQNYAAAVEQVKRITDKKPNVVAYWKELAVCYEKTNDVESLSKVDPKIVELDKQDIPSRQRLAKYAMDHSDVATALGLYKELAVLTPNDAKVFKNLYEISKQKSNDKDAILYLKNFLMLDSSSADSHKALAEMLFSQGNTDEALDSYRKALRKDPAIKGIYKNYVSILIKKKLETEAVTAINLAIKAGEADAPAYIALGDIYKKQGNFQGAIKMYSEALKTDKSNVDVLTSLGESQAAAADVKGAITTYEQVVMLNPKATTENKVLGDLYMKIQKTESAIKAYQEYMKKVPDDQQVASKIGMYEFDNKKYDDAVKYLEMVKDAKLQEAGYFTALGTSYYYLNDFKKAAELFAKVRAKKPENTVLKLVLKLQADAYEKVGDMAKAADAYAAFTKIPGVKDADASYKRAFLIEKSDKADALAAYTENTVAFPQDPRSYLRLGLIYAEDKASFPKAAAMLKKASALVDTIPDVWETMGQVYGKLKETDAELQAYQKLLKFKPQHLEANKRVGMILMERKQYTQGISCLETAQMMAPKDIEIIMLLADGYLATKRPTQAVDLLEKAKAIKPDDVKLREQLYSLLKETDQTDKAEAEVKGLIDLTKDNKYRLMYADALIAQKRFPDAAKILKEVSVADPENVNCLMLLGQVERAQNKYDEAIETYKTVLYIKGPYAPALTERGDVYLIQKDVENARKYYEKATEADAQYALAYLGLAKVAKVQNKPADYTKFLNKAKALDPNNKDIKAEIGSAGGAAQ